MNKVILMGRLTRDPEVRYSAQGENQMAIARYTLADLTAMAMKTVQILFPALHLARPESLRSGICAREPRLL